MRRVHSALRGSAFGLVLFGSLNSCVKDLTFGPASGGQGGDPSDSDGAAQATGGRNSGGTTAVGGSTGGDGASLGGGPLVGGSESSGGAPGAGGGTQSGGASSTGIGGSGVDCSYDDFSDPALTEVCYQSYNGEVLTAGTSPRGSLDEDFPGITFRPRGGVGFYDGDTGFALRRKVSGDFVLEVQVWVMEPKPSEEAPPARNAFAGIAAFSEKDEFGIEPVTGYYAIKMGTLEGSDQAGFSGEHTPVDSTVTERLQEPSDKYYQGSYLRLCRVGDQIWTGYKRAGDTEWQPLHANGEEYGYDTRTLSPLTDTLDVALLAEMRSSDEADGSVRVVFTKAEFAVPDDFDECQL